MGEVAEDKIFAVVKQQFQTPCRAFEGGYGIVELFFGHTQLPANQTRRVEVFHVVAAEYAHFPPAAVGHEQGGFQTIALEGMHTIAKGLALRALGNLFGLNIGLVINQAASRLDGADKMRNCSK